MPDDATNPSGAGSDNSGGGGGTPGVVVLDDGLPSRSTGKSSPAKTQRTPGGPVMARQTSWCRVTGTDGSGGVTVDRIAKFESAWHFRAERWTAYVSTGRDESGDWLDDQANEDSTAIWFGHRKADADKWCKAFLSQIFYIPRRAHQYGSDPDGNKIHRLEIGIDRAHFHSTDIAHGQLHHFGIREWPFSLGIARPVFMHHWPKILRGDDKWHWTCLVPSGGGGGPEPDPLDPTPDPKFPPGKKKPNAPTQPTGGGRGGGGGGDPFKPPKTDPVPTGTQTSGGPADQTAGDTSGVGGQNPVPTSEFPTSSDPGGQGGQGGAAVAGGNRAPGATAPTNTSTSPDAGEGNSQATPESQMQGIPQQPGPAKKIGHRSDFSEGGGHTPLGQDLSPRARGPSRYALGTQPLTGRPFLPEGPSMYSLGTEVAVDTGLLDVLPDKGEIDWTPTGIAADTFSQDDSDTLTDETWRIDLIDAINAATNRTAEIDARERASFVDDLGTRSILVGMAAVTVTTTLPGLVGVEPTVQVTMRGTATTPFYGTSQNADGTWDITVEVPFTNPGPGTVDFSLTVTYPVADTATLPC